VTSIWQQWAVGVLPHVTVERRNFW